MHGIVFSLFGCTKSDEAKYADAKKLLDEGKKQEAIEIFTELGEYEDSDK